MAQDDLTSIFRKPTRSLDRQTASELAKQLDVPIEVASRVMEMRTKRGAGILNDLPVSEDALGFDPLVQTLSSVALSGSTETPITIAVEGEWGTGKTSILRMMEAQARMLKFPCLWLNAWSLETTENLIAAVGSEVQRELRLRGDTKKERSAELARWMTRALLVVGKAAASVVPGLASPQLLEQLDKAVGFESVQRQRAEEVSELASIVTARYSFERLVRLVLGDSEEAESRLIVFVDDLDRAFPDQIANTLRNLKLVLEVPRCVFVLAMDAQIVAQSIREYYRSSRGAAVPDRFGHDYLEKLLQVRAEVPALTPEHALTFLRELGIAPDVSEIVLWAPDRELLNPRRLKRYINWLSLCLQLVELLEKPAGIRNITALRSLALRRSYPGIYKRLLGVEFFMPISARTIGFCSRTSDRFWSELWSSVSTILENETVISWLAQLPQLEPHLPSHDPVRASHLLRDSPAYRTSPELYSRVLEALLSGTDEYCQNLAHSQVSRLLPSVYNRLVTAESLLTARAAFDADGMRAFVEYARGIPRHELELFELFLRQNPVLHPMSKPPAPQEWMAP